MYYHPNITIAFSGYNIKNNILLAVDSLLKIYPRMKSLVLYFDECSTDGTVKELKVRGIRTISWDKELLNQYDEKMVYRSTPFREGIIYNRNNCPRNPDGLFAAERRRCTFRE